MTNELPLEIEKGLEKAKKKSDRAVRAAGYGASDEALWITKGYIGAVTEQVAIALQEQVNPNEPLGALVALLRNLPCEIIAMAALQGSLHCVAVSARAAETYAYIGATIASEAWAAGLREKHPALYDRVEQAARRKASSVSYRQQAARVMARKAKDGYHADSWSRDVKGRVGNWAVNQVLAAIPGVFEWETLKTGERLLTVSDGAMSAAVDAVTETIIRYPVYLPRETKPEPWTSWRQNGVTFLRTGFGDVIGAVKQAIADGSMRPALDAITALQSVPFRINKKLYGVIRGCMERGIEVKGLPHADVSLPEKVKPWQQMTELEQKQYKLKASEARQKNRALRSDRLLLTEDMQTAERLFNSPFYTPMNCDWRGRVYPLPHFSFQREDRVRALFEFADGLPIGEDGLRYLQLHVANCGDFDKISKQPVEERLQWTIKNTARIEAMCEVPLKDLWWTEADKPFLFLAACMELVAAGNGGTGFVTHLPVSFDGSCSGLQHLSAMTRDAETASLVNLTVGAKPNDVYGVIADAVKERIEYDTDPLAEKFRAFGIDRKVVKRNVMTYSYSSKKFGMASQQQTDLMDELQNDVIRGKLEEHPFAPSHKVTYDKHGGAHPGPAARFIASHVFEAIEQRIHRPAQAMKFLRSIAKALAHEGKPVRWTTPTGMPWVNRYHKRLHMTLRLWLHDRGVKQEIRTKVAVGFEKDIDKEKSANGIAPNFVHALDAAHLQLAVNGSVAAGILSVATVHDSFGCLAPQARLFNKVIRSTLVDMYEQHDVLSEILEQSRRDLTQHSWNKLPSVPEYGTLNLKEINHALYAFTCLSD